MFSCVIIDDEPIAVDVIRNHVERSGLLSIVAAYTSVKKAFAFLQKNSVDIIFIDIQMPGMTGLELIRSLPGKPRFIITSAYREYALDGYDLDVLDFLVKPVSYERFLKSLSKFVSVAAPAPVSNVAAARFIFIREGKKMSKIFLDDIFYLESQKDNVRITTKDAVLTTRGTMLYFEQWLPTLEFARVHRSYLVSLSRIKTCTEDEVEMNDGACIPIGDLYRKSFREVLQKYSL